MPSSKTGSASDSTDSAKRRSTHRNSHHGCLTCRKRHLKCGEEKPGCQRCHDDNRPCRWISDVPKPAQKLIFSVSEVSGAWLDGSHWYMRRCLEYFGNVMLPAFAGCEPSPIWAFVQTELCQSESVGRMAIALGHEHFIATTHDEIPPEEASNYYSDAIKSLRERIEHADDRKSPSTALVVVLHCILLVVLQCFRRSFDELNIHLQNGLRIALQATEDERLKTPVSMDECIRLLKQYSIAVALFNPLLPQNGLHATRTANQALQDPSSLTTTPSLSLLLENESLLRDEISNLVLDLIGTTITSRRPHMTAGAEDSLRFATSLDDNLILRDQVEEFRARHARVAAANQQKLVARPSFSHSRHLHINEATISLIGIYIQCRWNGYQCSFDQAYQSFANIVNRLELAIHNPSGHSSQTPSTSFSIGLGIIAPLFYVALMCREPSIRRRAVALMSRAPKQDGPWNTELAHLICKKIIELEESKAQEVGVGCMITNYIPEHCRVNYYYYRSVTTGPNNQQTEYLRVFLRQPGPDSIYVHEDIKLIRAGQ